MRQLLLLLLLAPALLSAQTPAYDLILRGGRIVDGTASPWYTADLAIKGDTIVRIAPSIAESAARVVDVKGLVVAPGFIDIHTHAQRGIFEVPTADNYVRQGVTTLIEGPDGGSPIPLAPFLAKVEATRITPNFAMFIGQGSIRSEVMGAVDRPATRAELDTMRALVTQGMEDGAFGLSSGLFYVPGAFTPTEEVIELARVAGRMGGIYISHMRDEAKGLTDSVRETIAIGEKGGLATQITHHKVVGKKYWGGSIQTLRMVDEARARGVDATIERAGLKADIAVFDASTIRDTAPFEKPHSYAEGVSLVIVNGQVAFEGGQMTSARPGRVLHGPAHRQK